MPVGGRLTLKGGARLKGGVFKKKKTKKAAAKQLEDKTTVKEQNATSVSVQSGKTYEQEFDLETQRAKAAEGRKTPWGTAFAKPPTILHGYDKEIRGDTAEKRLDIRCAQRTDKHCK